MDLRAEIEIPEFAGHPNRLPFEGVLTFVDTPSRAAPSGTRGHKILLTRSAAIAALGSLLGMPVNCNIDFKGHNEQRSAGIITAAWIDGEKLKVSGFVYGKYFPEIAAATERLGLSYELHQAQIGDLREHFWKITRMTFTGATICLEERAAYAGTSFKLKAAA